MDGNGLTAEEQEALKLLIQEHRIKKSTVESRPIVPRKFDTQMKFIKETMRRDMYALGLDPSSAINCARSRSVSRGKKRERSVAGGADDMDVDVDQPNKKLRLRSQSRSRSVSRPPGEVVPGESFKNSQKKLKAVKMGWNSIKKRNKNAKWVEGDRVIHNLKPKHLYFGKHEAGKTDRR